MRLLSFTTNLAWGKADRLSESEMNPKLTLRRLGAVAILATLGAGLLAGSNASSPEQRRDAALDKAITAGMQRASIPGAIVGIWQS